MLSILLIFPTISHTLVESQSSLHLIISLYVHPVGSSAISDGQVWLSFSMVGYEKLYLEALINKANHLFSKVNKFEQVSGVAYVTCDWPTASWVVVT